MIGDTTTPQGARIIPVMDLMDGVVVAGKAGKRDSYKPISSTLIGSPDPFCFVEYFHGRFGFNLFYVADLDAIAGKGGNAGIIESLAQKTQAEFIVDGGYASLEDAPSLKNVTPVISTESFTGWDRPCDLSLAVVSIDFVGGEIISSGAGLTAQSALQYARDNNCKRFIHLRIDAVGRKRFDSRFATLTRAHEDWMYGGGVGSPHDLTELARLGYGSALVSTALRDGSLACQSNCVVASK